jgi:hypothetical protein
MRDFGHGLHEQLCAPIRTREALRLLASRVQVPLACGSYILQRCFGMGCTVQLAESPFPLCDTTLLGLY